VQPINDNGERDFGAFPQNESWRAANRSRNLRGRPQKLTAMTAIDLTQLTFPTPPHVSGTHFLAGGTSLPVIFSRIPTPTHTLSHGSVNGSCNSYIDSAIVHTSMGVGYRPPLEKHEPQCHLSM
jgi:hypothetical protein